jgi:quercetin dioxygenase-like cupin family protein
MSKQPSVLHLSSLFDGKLNVERMVQDVRGAEKLHEYTQKAFQGWTSIPLRSLDGMTGRQASNANGQHASSDPSIFVDTPIMQPYLSEVVRTIEGNEEGHGLLKVRLMKLAPGATIKAHTDRFGGFGKVLRLHIPIVSDPRVVFTVNNAKYVMEVGKVYSLNVLHRHAVHNGSDKDRIHMVFDVLITSSIQKKIDEAALALTIS